MKKIIVIGSPGAGKSVFSKKLKYITNISLYHIDMLYHKKDGTHITKEELEEKLKQIFKTDEWIIDGNYQKTLELRIKECDTIFLLDFPTQVCLDGAKSRIGKKRDDLPWINIKKIIVYLYLNLEMKQISVYMILIKNMKIYNLKVISEFFRIAVCCIIMKNDKKKNVYKIYF